MVRKFPDSSHSESHTKLALQCSLRTVSFLYSNFRIMLKAATRYRDYELVRRPKALIEIFSWPHVRNEKAAILKL